MKNLVLLTSLMLGLLVGPTARAGVMIDFTMDTSPLIGSSAGPFYAAFQFFDTSMNPGNNTVTISNFSGGSPLGSVVAGTGTSGDLSSVVTLNDVDALAVSPPFGFYQKFTPGTTLSFQLAFTGVADGDAFTFQILEDNLGDPIPIATLDPSLGDAFLSVIFDSLSNPTMGTFGSDTNIPLANGSFVDIAPGTASFSNAAVPEPSSMVVFGLIATGLVVKQRRRRA